jgi:diaminopimelate decarboxylase
MNLDNFQELDRVATLLQQEPELLKPGQHIGLRINPQVSLAVADSHVADALATGHGGRCLEAPPQTQSSWQLCNVLSKAHDLA